MIYRHAQNKWFEAGSLYPVVKAIHETARNEPTKWLECGLDCKYVEVRVDMRTGDFCFKNAFGDLLSDADILRMFPSLGSVETFGEQA